MGFMFWLWKDVNFSFAGTKTNKQCLFRAIPVFAIPVFVQGYIRNKTIIMMTHL